jgi:putative transposase
MKRSRFMQDQIIGTLNEHEAGVSVVDLCRKHGISDATVYKWKAKSGLMDVSEAKRLKGLEDENVGLKRLVADAAIFLSFWAVPIVLVAIRVRSADR